MKDIAVAVIFDDRGRILNGRRPEAAALGGLWELPGGKIEPGETPERAAERECREELGCCVIAERLLGCVEHAYSEFSVRLHAVFCVLEPGQIPEPRATTELRWMTPEEMSTQPIPEANHALIELIMREKDLGSAP